MRTNVRLPKTHKTPPEVDFESVLSPTQVLIKLHRIVFPTTIQLMGDHTSFVEEVPLDLQCLPMIIAI